MKHFFLLGLMILVSAGCVHKVVYTPEKTAAATEKDSLNASVGWLKNKKDSVDIQVKFYNGYEEDIIIKENAWRLTYNDEKVAATSGMNELNLRSHGTYERVLVFPLAKTSKERQGEVILDIDPIRREKDSKTVKPVQFKLPLKVTPKTGYP